jgi:hypothetical protein
MEEIDFKELDNIPIPEGLEERLSASIDKWEKAEHKHTQRLRKTAVAIAASVLAVAGISIYFYADTSSDDGTSDTQVLASSGNGTTDTYSDPKVAYREAEKAIDLLAYNLNRGIRQYEEATDKCRRIQESMGKQTNIKE